MTRQGLLFPAVPAIALRRRDEYLLIDVASGLRGRIRGTLCSEIDASLEARHPTPRLAGLADAHPALDALRRWLTTPAVPFDAGAALALDGWDTLFVELTGRCNERCQHCYASSSPEVEAGLDAETAEGVIDDAAVLGFRRVQFTGGDPLLWPGLPALVERAASRGIAEREIYTNGLALTAALLERLAPSRPSLAFSFYADQPAIHDGITGVPGSQARTLAAIRRTLDRGLEVRAAIVVMEPNADRLAATQELLWELGVKLVSWSSSFAVGRGGRFDGGRVVPADRLRHEPGALATDRASAHGGGRASSSGKLAVTYRGEVVPCIFARDRVLGRLGPARLLDVARAPRLALRLASGREASLADSLECGSCRLTGVALELLAGAA